MGLQSQPFDIPLRSSLCLQGSCFPCSELRLLRFRLGLQVCCSSIESELGQLIFQGWNWSRSVCRCVEAEYRSSCGDIPGGSTGTTQVGIQ